MKSFSQVLLLFLLVSCQPNSSKFNDSSNTKPPNILFLIADDWSYPHASILGDEVVKTPNFDRLATEGALFHHAYCASPSCAPSRAAILTSRYPHQLESAGNLWSVIPKKFPNWMTILSENGYFTGHERKGWSPGDFKQGGYEHNPAGQKFDDFTTFLAQKPKNTPFAYWFGSKDPHRTYVTNTGIQSGLQLKDVDVPNFLPDTDCVRNDMLDYYFEVERFDRECGELIAQLEENGQLDNTLIFMTSDNGMPFPRAKANLYDYGTRMPLAVYWKGQVKAGISIDEFVNFVDFGPTILEAAGQSIPTDFSGKSILFLLKNEASTTNRNAVFLERERHANVRKGDLSYPMRAIRTQQYLYIRNFEPDRWPAGDPTVHQSVGQYGDVDNSISKFLILAKEGQQEPHDYFQLAFGKRPAEELYDLQKDPFQLQNVANQPSYSDIQRTLEEQLRNWMAETNDIRLTGPNTIYWDTVLYTPDYQFENFNLAKELNDYRITPSKKEEKNLEEIPCL
ncbi:MAG: sulfatase [Bacteroidota bacterium]